MVKTKQLTDDEKVELTQHRTRIKEILKGVHNENLPANADESVDVYDIILNETKYDILIDEMVPPEALDSNKKDNERWCLVHHRLEINGCQS